MGNYPVGRATTGEDKSGDIRDGHIHERDGHNGQLVFTRPDILFNPRPAFFINPTKGIDMNVNGAFSGTPEIIHNGGTSTEWTGSALSGTWDFSTGGVVTATDMQNNNAATFSEETPTTIDVSGFVALTMQVDIDTYDELNNSMQIQFDLAGVLVGDELNIDDFINTGDFSAQQAVIPIAEFNFASNDVDGFTISFTKSGGTKPTVKFDNIQLEQSGTPFDFRVNKDPAMDYYIFGFRFTIADAMAKVEYDKFMALTALVNGVTFSRVQNGEVDFSTPIRQLSDFMRIGSDLRNTVHDGTITADATKFLLTFQVDFELPIILQGPPERNYISLVVNDNLTGVDLFNATAHFGADKTN